MLTYKSLYELLVEEIALRSSYSSTEAYKDSLNTSQVTAPISSSIINNITADSASLVSSISKLLESVIPSQIVSGLTVSAKSPANNQITIEAGTGVIGGKVYNLSKDVTLTVPFTSYTSLFFVNIYLDGIRLDTNVAQDRLNIAKIIVPRPGVTARVIDTQDGSWDAYITNLKPITLYTDGKGNLEEDSIEFFRNNIKDILASNLIGNIRLSEDLKITNTSGNLEINSNSIQISDINGNVLSKFNDKGTFYYTYYGAEVARFASDGARVGNINILPNSIESRNFIEGNSGFRLLDDGNAEFNDLEVRGTIYATGGEIGGWAIVDDEIYALADSGRTPSIKTSEIVQEGATGVILDRDGLRGYDAILGTVFNLPTDGSAPTFSSGIINSTIFEINTNAIIRTSETVGDGTSNSAGILINDTGLYGLGVNQTPANANLKVLATGTIRLEGEINATSGQVGNVTITPDKLSGGLIEGTTIIAATIQTDSVVPRITISTQGLIYEVLATGGKYGASGSGLYGFQYGDGTVYGTGLSAALFTEEYPALAILAEVYDRADIRLFNRGAAPVSGGDFANGDLIVVNSQLQIFTGTNFEPVGGGTTFLDLVDVPDTYAGAAGYTVKVNGAGNALEFIDVTAGAFADEDLGNLSSVAINTDLVSDSNNVDSLGTDALEWKDIWIDGIAYLDAVDMHGNLDFNKNQAVAMRFENVTSDPSSPSTGQVWIRTDL